MAGARFGIVLLPESLRDFGPLCREAEATGFQWLGVADSQSVFHELYVALTLAALETSRIRLGPLVTNPQTRHLVDHGQRHRQPRRAVRGAASARARLGDSAIYTLGAPPATVAGLEEAIDTLRSLTSGEAVRRAGRIWQVHRARRRVPIYLAAEGPRTLELAGRVPTA